MASASRTKQFADVHKILKRHYKPVKPDPERPVLEHLLLACCLEDSHYEPAEETFAVLVHTFFDWNEIRVTSVRELGEVMAGLPDPRAAANRLKRVLQGVFEETYSFDLEDQRKKNLGPTVKWLRKIDGTSNFTVAYVVQSALGGHAIPVDSGVLEVLRLLDLISDKDVEAGVVPGLDRAVSKSKGVEFGSMLHQLGADFTANPYSLPLRNILLEINPDAAEQLPKRRATKPAEKKPSDKQPQPAQSAVGTPTGQSQASGKKEASPQKKTAGSKRASAADEKRSSTAKKKPAATKKSSSSARQKTTSAKAPPQTTGKKGKSASVCPGHTERLSKQKPR